MEGHIINYGKLVGATFILAKSYCEIHCIFPVLNFKKTFGLYNIKLKKATFLNLFQGERIQKHQEQEVQLLALNSKIHP